MESKEITEDVSERFGEMMWSSPLQETMRLAMRFRDKRTRLQSDLFQSLASNSFPYFGSGFGAPVSGHETPSSKAAENLWRPSSPTRVHHRPLIATRT